mmetsp:Transcript_152997/g.267379  ORF Transcript_152997/g.267379 Transcript_152997/m.267379 type:complete len:201 (+) Transcript_152997:2911-3513(+)
MLGEHGRDSHGVGDEPLTTFALLPGVGTHGHREGLLDGVQGHGVEVAQRGQQDLPLLLNQSVVGLGDQSLVGLAEWHDAAPKVQARLPCPRPGPDELVQVVQDAEGGPGQGALGKLQGGQLGVGVGGHLRLDCSSVAMGRHPVLGLGPYRGGGQSPRIGQVSREMGRRWWQDEVGHNRKVTKGRGEAHEQQAANDTTHDR